MIYIGNVRRSGGFIELISRRCAKFAGVALAKPRRVQSIVFCSMRRGGSRGIRRAFLEDGGSREAPLLTKANVAGDRSPATQGCATPAVCAAPVMTKGNSPAEGWASVSRSLPPADCLSQVPGLCPVAATAEHAEPQQRRAQQEQNGTEPRAFEKLVGPAGLEPATTPL